MSDAEPRSTSLNGGTILIVDDNPANLRVLLEVLEAGGSSVLVATDGRRALAIAAQARPDLVLLDVMMPAMDGYEVCRRLKASVETKDIPVIFLTARTEKADVIAGFAAGGLDYVTKPFQEEEVLARVATHVQLRRLHLQLQAAQAALTERNQELERALAQRQALQGQLSLLSHQEAERWGLDELVGQSPTMRAIFAKIQLMQDNPRTSVLISGESGTGKELIARAIHFGSPRQDKPFVAVNCGAIPRELVESALFGHVRGAFTGATTDRPGYFAMADGGTLFLDEIADMPTELQGRLLRVLEDGQVWPVGATRPRAIDVRVLSATNANLAERLERGSFRRDLYFRLARYTVEAPPLRERREDIPLLAQHFVRLFAKEMGRPVQALSAAIEQSLTRADFPGNVRELKNIVERALIESRGAEIQWEHLRLPAALPLSTAENAASGRAPAAERHLGPADGPVAPLDLDDAAHQAERRVIEEAIARCGGNVTEAARLLRTSRNRIYRVLGGKGPVRPSKAATGANA